MQSLRQILPTELQPLQKGLTYVLLVSSGHCLLETSRASESMSGWGTYEKPGLGELTAEVCCKTQHSHGSNTTRAGASSQVLKQESEDSQAKTTQNVCLDLHSVIPKVTPPASHFQVFTGVRGIESPPSSEFRPFKWLHRLPLTSSTSNPFICNLIKNPCQGRVCLQHQALAVLHSPSRIAILAEKSWLKTQHS